MPVVRVGDEALRFLIEEASKLEISVRSLVDYIVLRYFGELDEDVDEDVDEEDQDEEEDGEDEEE